MFLVKEKPNRGWAASGACSPLGDLLVAQLQLRLQVLLWEEERGGQPAGHCRREGVGTGMAEDEQMKERQGTHSQDRNMGPEGEEAS